jgi:hypothetical protein
MSTRHNRATRESQSGAAPAYKLGQNLRSFSRSDLSRLSRSRRSPEDSSQWSRS